MYAIEKGDVQCLEILQIISMDLPSLLLISKNKSFFVFLNNGKNWVVLSYSSVLLSGRICALANCYVGSW